MYLAAIKLTRTLFLCTLIALVLWLLLPKLVPPWLPLVLGFCCVSLFLFASLHITRSRRRELRCPLCGWMPFALNAWKCKQCGFVWDSFATGGVCPRCGHAHEETACLRCRRISPNNRWVAP